MDDLITVSRKNRQARIIDRKYPGRGLIVGADQTAKYFVQVYWIMGRSPNSRNRVFKEATRGRVYTAPADPAAMTDPSLVIYNAMREHGSHYIVSNGNQTDTVSEKLRPSGILQESLLSRKYEPDAPNFTPRITAMCSLKKQRGAMQISVLRKSLVGEGCEECNYSYEDVLPGFGHCVTTYETDGDPLLPFRGEPFVLPLWGSIHSIADEYFHALNADNRISLVVKFINRRSGKSKVVIHNKYEEA